jgi:hypothetical protein
VLTFQSVHSNHYYLSPEHNLFFLFFLATGKQKNLVNYGRWIPYVINIGDRFLTSAASPSGVVQSHRNASRDVY